MTKPLEARVENLEAQVIALKGLLLSFMIANRRAHRLVMEETASLAEDFCDDAEQAGLEGAARELDLLLEGFARVHESGKDPELRRD